MRAPFCPVPFATVTAVLAPRLASDFARLTSCEVPNVSAAGRFSRDMTGEELCGVGWWDVLWLVRWVVVESSSRRVVVRAGELLLSSKLSRAAPRLNSAASYPLPTRYLPTTCLLPTR